MFNEQEDVLKLSVSATCDSGEPPTAMLINVVGSCQTGCQTDPQKFITSKSVTSYNAVNALYS